MGGLIGIVAIYVRARADQQAQFSRSRTEAYLDYIDWVAKMRRAAESEQRELDPREWDGGPAEARVFAFGSDPVRFALGRLADTRTESWWRRDREAATLTASLANQIGVSMEREIRGEKPAPVGDLKRFNEHAAKLYVLAGSPPD